MYVKEQSDKLVGLDNIFSNLEYKLNKGRGYSFYNANELLFEEVISVLRERSLHTYNIVRMSELKDQSLKKIDNPLIIFQDLEYEAFLIKVDTLVNKFVYPAWFKGHSIFFISALDKSEYMVMKIDSTLIHSDYKRVIDLLSLEQLDNILTLINVTINDSDLISIYNEEVAYTPIELIFRNELIQKNIQFQSQVKIDNYYVDFLLKLNNSNVIVECDGRDYHSESKDKERDKSLKRHGYKIFRFPGSRIFNECDKCLDEVLSYNKKFTKNKYHLEILNEEQVVAVDHISGPMRLLAPAGSGKTKTLVNRIVSLINKGIDSSEILALAFNKKAQDEMKNRLNDKYGLNDIQVKTFHSFGNHIIKEMLKWKFDGDKVDANTRKFLNEAIEESNHKLPRLRNADPLDSYLSMLSKVKNELIPVEEFIVETDREKIDFEPIFNNYLKVMNNNNFYNFDDMLYIAVRLLLTDQSLRRKIQNRYRYILVDEFQDLNKVQILLLQIICLPENNLFIVGDDDQMIFGFRGAEVRHILEFNNRYAITKDQALKVNYRSCSDIVLHSKWLIDHNQSRVYKEITPHSDEKGDVSLSIGNSLKEQAEEIAKWILALKNENRKWSDFAILYRYNEYTDFLYIVLSQFNIPVSINRIKILSSPVGKCIFAYLQVIYDSVSCDQNSFSIILNKPNKYFQNVFVETIKTWEDFIDIESNKRKLRQMDIDRYVDFVNKVTRIKSKVADMTAKQIVTTIIEDLGVREFWKDQAKTHIEIDSSTPDDIIEIIVALAESFKTVGEFYKFWIEFDRNNNLEADSGKPENKKDEVILSTIHKTKENEFQHVAYFNLSRRNTDKLSETEIEEERRVTYVAVTRPMQSLLITSQKGDISPFVNEYFLNPMFKGISTSGLTDKRNVLETRLNVENVDLARLNRSLEELVNKYPELIGEYRELHGAFKRIKEALRRKSVRKALRNYEDLNIKKKEFFDKTSTITNEITYIEKEIKFRSIVYKV